MKQVKFWKSIIVLGLLFICSASMVYPATAVNKSKEIEQKRDPRKERKLKGILRNLNEACPYGNGEARYDKFELQPNGEVGIYITYMGDAPLYAYSDEELAALDTSDSKAAMIEVINTSAWSPLREMEPAFILFYRDQEGRNLFQIKIAPSDYKGKGGAGELSKNEKIQELVNSMNKMCPMKMNDAVTYQHVKLLADNEVEIFISYKKDTPLSKYKDEDLRKLDGAMKKGLLPQLQDDSWAILRSYGATFVMSYNDKNGRELFRIKMYPEDFND